MLKYKVNGRFFGEEFFSEPTDVEAIALHDFYDGSWRLNGADFTHMLVYSKDSGHTNMLELREMLPLNNNDADEWVAAVIRYETFLEYELQAWLCNAKHTGYIDYEDDEEFEPYPGL